MNDEQRRAWLERRKQGIGASEVGAIVGVDPRTSPFQVWARKRGLADEAVETERMRFGRRFEAPIADETAERLAIKLEEVPEEETPLKLAGHPLVLATPDRLVVGDPDVVEIKNVGASQAHEWGPEGTDDIPERVICQGQQQLAVTGRKVCHVAACFGGNELRLYRVFASIDLQAYLVEAVERFWQDHVVTGDPPRPDASEQTAKTLARMWKVTEGADYLDSDPGLDELVEALREAEEQEKTAADEAEETRNILRLRIGAHRGLRGRWGRIDFKPDSQGKVNWKDVAEELGASQAIANKHRGEPPRPFRVYWAQKEK